MIASDSTVTLLDSMGSDLTVVNAARVSFGKQKDSLDGSDGRLINYLAKHEHISPFFHPQVSLHMMTPIFVARQLMRHQIGLAINEESRRYVDYHPEFYMPENWRKRDPNIKQGSKQDEFVWFLGFDSFGIHERVKRHYEDSMQLYTDMLEAGVAPEQARMVLPLSMMTQWIWTGSLYAWARICKHRLPSDAQKEVRDVGKQIDEIVQPLFPHSWNALLQNIREDAAPV